MTDENMTDTDDTTEDEPQESLEDRVSAIESLLADDLARAKATEAAEEAEAESENDE